MSFGRAYSIARSVRTPLRRAAFDPRYVPEVAAGYLWLPRAATGFGTTGFKVPELNGHTTFNLPQATVLKQPTLLTENGGVQFRMRKSVDANPSVLISSGSAAAGWMGATYIAGWFRLPDASGDITGVDVFFTHTLPATNLRLSLSSSSATDTLTATPSVTGASITGLQTRWANPLLGGAWHWLEWIFDPLLVLGGSTMVDKFKLFCDLVLLARFDSNPTADATSMFNGVAPLQLATRTTSAANIDTTDWCNFLYVPGVPSAYHRDRLRRDYAPIVVG